LKFIITKISSLARPQLLLTTAINPSLFTPHNTTYNCTSNIKNLSDGLMLLG